MKKLILPCIFSLILCACTAAEEPDTGLPLNASQAVLTLKGMSCPLCANNVDGRLKKVDGVEEIKIDLETGQVTVRFTKPAPTRSKLETAIKESGFTLSTMELIP